MTTVERILARLAPALGLVALACGGSTSSGTAGPTVAATAGEVRAICDSICARTDGCEPEGAPPDCVDACVADQGELATGIRADVARALASCFEGVPCEQSDDICLEQALRDVGEDPDRAGDAADVQACLSKQDECQDTPASFPDDLCGSLVALVTSRRDAAARCFGGTCERLPACLEPIFGDI